MKQLSLFTQFLFLVSTVFSQKIKRCETDYYKQVDERIYELQNTEDVSKIDTSIKDVPVILMLEDQSGKADSVFIDTLVGSMTSIRILTLFYPNYYGVTNTVFLPSSIGKLSNLESMDASCGNLIIPEEFANCNRLKFLHIHGTNNGRLPEFINDLDSLAHLEVYLKGGDIINPGKMIKSLKTLKNNSVISAVEIWCPWYTYPRAFWVSRALRRKGICAYVII